MIPSSFDESNTYLSAPNGMPDCLPLSCYIGNDDTKHPVIISCFKLTKEELEEINKTGRVWLTVAGQTMPPVVLSGISPWRKKAQDDSI